MPQTPTQELADSLMAMPKRPALTAIVYLLPITGGRITVPLTSHDGRESFTLDLNRKRKVLTTSYQTRARKEIVLARLDFGAPHRNPDGEEIGVPHLHLYREGYGDKWAYDVPEGMLRNPSDNWQVLQDFMKYCNVTEVPNFERELLP